ncbi:MAG: hypothetical protein E6394_09275 [Veillonella sp.]|nr:hypothetical protein [Veillonella sp.]
MNKKHLATAFAVFAATTMSFSAFAATIDANARAYERASAEQYSYPAPQAATPAYQTSYATSAPRPGYKPLPAVPYTAGDMAQQMPVSKELGDPIFVAPQTTAVGLQIMDPIPTEAQPVYQEITEAVVNNNSLRITVNMTQPTAVAAAKLRSMQQTGQVASGEVAALFAYNESYDGVKQAAHYDIFNNNGRYIVVKSGAVTVPNGAQHPYATALFAVTEDTVAAVTVSGNTAEASDLVKGTAYAIAQSAKVSNNKVSTKSKK